MTATRLALVCVGSLFLTAMSSDRAGDQIDGLMQRYQGPVPGVSLLVVRDGKAIVRRSYGLADLENRVPAASQTNYRLASVTKQFTASAVMLLAQDGKLSISDRVKRWLPSLPPALDSVTIKQLLTHTSGIVDYEDVIPDGTTTQLHDMDVLHLLESQDSLYFKAGTSYRYSNSGYALLALIVERASGKRFSAFLHDRIFAPLGMKNTVAHEEGFSVVPNRAYGYTLQDSAWARKDQSVTSAVLGDGGIYSSTDDLAKWDAALYDSRLLSDTSRDLAFSPHTTTDDPEIMYGFGWRITGETIWHSGETSGFRNVIVRYPSRRLTVIILSNRDGEGPYRLALSIAKLFF
jgi:CubicO group peptidase (beta-lactamase class C family)